MINITELLQNAIIYILLLALI